jgi:hypothetical protein
MSGNEKSENEDEKLNYANKKTGILTEDKGYKITPKVSQSYTNSNSNDKLQINKSNKIKGFTNTEFNNKRFEKASSQIIIEEGLNSISQNKKKGKNEKLLQQNDSNISKIKKEKFMEEEIERTIPQPFRNKYNIEEKLKLNDFKLKKTPNVIKETPTNSNNLYMPDFMATKLVDEILLNKLIN